MIAELNSNWNPKCFFIVCQKFQKAQGPITEFHSLGFWIEAYGDPLRNISTFNSSGNKNILLDIHYGSLLDWI